MPEHDEWWRITDAEWREYQSIPEQGYSHRYWIESRLIATRLNAAIDRIKGTQPCDLAEQGRRLASERDDLIAAGVDPADLLIPLHPQPTEQESAE